MGDSLQISVGRSSSLGNEQVSKGGRGVEISKRRLQQTLHMKIEYEPCHMRLSSLCNYRDSDAGTKMEFLCRGCQCRVHTGVCSACLLRALLDLRNKIRRLKTESEAIEDRMRHRLEHKIRFDRRRDRILAIRDETHRLRRCRYAAERHLADASASCRELAIQISHLNVTRPIEELNCLMAARWKEISESSEEISYHLQWRTMEIQHRTTWAIMDSLSCVPSFESLRAGSVARGISDHQILELCAISSSTSKYLVESLSLVSALTTVLCIHARLPLPYSCCPSVSANQQPWHRILSLNTDSMKGIGKVSIPRLETFASTSNNLTTSIFPKEAFSLLRHGANMISNALRLNPLPPSAIVSHSLEWFITLFAALLTQEELSTVNNPYVHCVITNGVDEINRRIREALQELPRLPDKCSDDDILEDWVVFGDLAETKPV